VQGLAPVVASALPRGPQAAIADTLAHLRTTHDSRKLEAKAEQYVVLLARMLQGAPM
jgi:hypothetical protein